MHDRFPRSGHGGGSGAAWRRLAAELARRLDATAVRLRSNLAHSVFGRYALGRAGIQAGDPRAAIEHFDRLLARHPDNVPALLAKANALIAVDRFQEATKVYRHVVRLAPRDGAVRYNYGVLLCRQVEFAAAVEQFRQLVRIDPDHARGWHNLATLAQRAGRLAEARDAWLAFTRLEPAAADGWFQLGVVWMDFDKPDQAAACFNRFVALDTGDPAGWLNLGFSRAAAGRLDAALDAMAAARDLTPGDPTVLHHLADLHAMIADRGGPDAGHHRAVAGRLREQIDSREADRAGKRALAAGPSEDRE